MAIDLQRFSEPVETSVPFLNGKSIFRGRKIDRIGIKDGWYRVMLADTVAVLRESNQVEAEMALQHCSILKGFSLGDQFIPLNFNNLEQLGFEQSAPLIFNQSDVWDVIKAGLWEDGNFYFAEIDYGFPRDVIEEVRRAFEADKPIKDIKGATPELKYYFILLSLHRESHRKLQELAKMKLAEAERQKRLKEFQKTFAGRLEKVIEEGAGGKLVRFVKKGKDQVLVVWKIGGQKIKTLINDEMGVLDLGYCASGRDRDHSLKSAVLLAKIFQEEEGSVYIMRE